MSTATRAPLMAKSLDPRFSLDALSLTGHSLRVELAARALFESIGRDIEAVFGLDVQSLAQLRRLVNLAALLHDIGKATRSFQDTVVMHSKERHPWRHELLSAGALHSENLLRRWLTAHLDEDDLALVSMMVAGHHLRAARDMIDPRIRRDEQLLLASRDLRPVWERAARILAASTLPDLEGGDATLDPDAGSDFVADYAEAGRESDRRRDRQSPVLPLGKALVIAADIVGSAHTGELQIDAWINDVLEGGLTAEELGSVVQSRLNGVQPRDFQKRIAASDDSVTVVTAGCGNGKTLAAYLWAQRRVLGRRLAFCYPTTGTTTAGFADYLLSQSHLERRLLHSRARVDVESFERSPDEDEPLDLWAPDVLDRWSAHVVACTADTVLGLMTNWRTSLASIPLWAKCAFVFDEVHSYDRKLFGALLAFLSVVQAPILLMTASLTPARREALGQVLGRTVEPIEGDTAIESAPRYRLVAATATAAAQETAAAVRCGKKVLWVSNTVARAQATYRALREEIGPDAIRVYHSRFRYQDRVDRQAEVIERFRGDAGMAIVATQVCEMSLDLSADLLVTEIAPFSSLVQRLGRLNRRDPVPPSTKPCLWIEPKGARPYAEAELETTHTVLSRLGEAPLSQRDLADALDSLEEAPYEIPAMPFTAQTWTTFPVPLRESTPSWTVVRRGDLPPDLSKARRADVLRNEIRMPERGVEFPNWPRVHGVLVAPDGLIDYSLEEGASWAA